MTSFSCVPATSIAAAAVAIPALVVVAVCLLAYTKKAVPIATGEKARDAHVDNTKFLVMVLVVFHHLIGMMGIYPQQAVGKALRFHMPVFCMISGKVSQTAPSTEWHWVTRGGMTQISRSNMDGFS
eukprot:gnl/TRDRNA2_/TRDRNA2_149734_c0_seq3.p2 gnl/TRDRNA2_/TRDRNA2_149734_c0~~gnl/TRDRNA2_/TRDRNA2_149734_c0_seq3.p2  ORF type:complete len:126 (-),score=21.06 gnl/TRDRNA2_/TRDRNA2_149734_c0_seq3:1020-1397(-)